MKLRAIPEPAADFPAAPPETLNGSALGHVPVRALQGTCRRQVRSLHKTLKRKKKKKEKQIQSLQEAKQQLFRLVSSMTH